MDYDQFINIENYFFHDNEKAIRKFYSVPNPVTNSVPNPVMNSVPIKQEINKKRKLNQQSCHQYVSVAFVIICFVVFGLS